MLIVSLQKYFLSKKCVFDFCILINILNAELAHSKVIEIIKESELIIFLLLIEW